jgi:hypothetical protein
MPTSPLPPLNCPRRLHTTPFQNSALSTSWSAWSQKTPNADTASSFSAQEPIKGRRSWPRSRCALWTSQLRCAKWLTYPGRRLQSDFDLLIERGAKSLDDTNADAGTCTV